MSRRASPREPVRPARGAVVGACLAPVIVIALRLSQSTLPAVRSAHLGPRWLRAARGRTSDLVAATCRAAAAVAITSSGVQTPDHESLLRSCRFAYGRGPARNAEGPPGFCWAALPYGDAVHVNRGWAPQDRSRAANPAWRCTPARSPNGSDIHPLGRRVAAACYVRCWWSCRVAICHLKVRGGRCRED